MPDLLAEQAGIVVHDLFGNNAATTTVDMRGFGVTGAQNTLILVDGRRVVDIDLSGVQWSAVPLDRDRAHRDRARRRQRALRRRRDRGRDQHHHARRRGARASAHAARQRRIVRHARRQRARQLSRSGASASSVFGSHLESDGYRDNNQNRQTNALADLRWSGAPGDFRAQARHRQPGHTAAGRAPGAAERGREPARDRSPRRADAARLGAARRQPRALRLAPRRSRSASSTSAAAGATRRSARTSISAAFPTTAKIELSRLVVHAARESERARCSADANTLVVGLDWYSWDYQLRRSNSPANIPQPFNTIDARQDTVGVYALDTIELTERLSLSAGARRERLRIDATDRSTPAAPGGAFGSGAPAGSQRLYENAYELGAALPVHAREAAVMAKTARSYRFANVDEIYETSPAFTQPVPVPAAADRALARGRRRAARAARHGARATVFEIDVDDEIHLDPFTHRRRQHEPAAVAAARARARSATRGRCRSSSSRAAYSYIEAKFREGVLAGGLFTAAERRSRRARPCRSCRGTRRTCAASWDFTPATRLSALLSYVGAQFMDNDEPNSLGVKIPSYTLARSEARAPAAARGVRRDA